MGTRLSKTERDNIPAIRKKSSTDSKKIEFCLSGRGLNPRAATETSLLYIVPPLRIQNVAQQPALPPRARIITSGLGGVFPRGLLVGFLIDGARGDETNLEQEGDVEPAVDFLSLENVFIRRAD